MQHLQEFWMLQSFVTMERSVVGQHLLLARILVVLRKISRDQRAI